ncbi:MAG: bifunctional glutamate N-acetyltransferase/amino-acid acetyltransferase ArgJ [Candidatus Omnitrophica bacterium]|nr:bifunctional glutamate N-acetyltransferase/amino-acid acetyltransferase ArgJ [Candidatus Omnitrophota bacterium]
MKIVKGSLTAPKGFLANGIKAGIKKSGRKDLAIICSEVPAIAAAAFTKNKFQAAPVRVSKLHLKNKTHQAIIVNSGNANCANGKIGDRDALLMTEFTAEALSVNENEILIASTGVIGKYLPIQKISGKIPELIDGLSEHGGEFFAEAIMTTDTRKKEAAVRFKLDGIPVTIAGACKGVGMICPDMKVERHATLLCFLTTDAAISKKMLEEALYEAIGGSLNMISVDGDMSTNDSCFILANGLAGNKRIGSRGTDYGAFLEALELLTENLAKMLVADGEGATKFVEIEVTGAKNTEDAKKIARKISNSNLLKCCIFGNDPNWGRVIAACGASDADFNPDKVDVYLGKVKVFSDGARIKKYDEKSVKKLFAGKDIYIKIDLKGGRNKATAWTCDLSKEYVAINSEYST